MIYQIEMWVHNEIREDDFPERPLVVHHDSDKVALDFTKRNTAGNILIQVSVEANDYEAAVKKFNQYTEVLYSDIAFLSTTPMSVVPQSPMLVKRILDDKHRDGVFRLPYKDLGNDKALFRGAPNLKTEDFDDYLEPLRETDGFSVLEKSEYRTAMSLLRLAIQNTYPTALLFLYFAIESLVPQSDSVPKCKTCGVPYACNCSPTREYTYHSKDPKAIDALMNEMGFHEHIKKGLRDIRHKISHGNVGLYKALLDTNEMQKKFREYSQAEFERSQEEVFNQHDAFWASQNSGGILSKEDIEKRDVAMERFQRAREANGNNLFDETILKFRNYLFKKTYPDRLLPPKYLTRTSVPIQFYRYTTDKVSDDDFTLETLLFREDVDVLATSAKIDYITEPSPF